jgi:hypothetical protein
MTGFQSALFVQTRPVPINVTMPAQNKLPGLLPGVSGTPMGGGMQGWAATATGDTAAGLYGELLEPGTPADAVARSRTSSACSDITASRAIGGGDRSENRAPHLADHRSCSLYEAAPTADTSPGYEGAGLEGCVARLRYCAGSRCAFAALCVVAIATSSPPGSRTSFTVASMPCRGLVSLCSRTSMPFGMQ